MRIVEEFQEWCKPPRMSEPSEQPELLPDDESAEPHAVAKPRILSRPQKTLQEVMFREALGALPQISTLTVLGDLRLRL